MGWCRRWGTPGRHVGVASADVRENHRTLTPRGEGRFHSPARAGQGGETHQRRRGRRDEDAETNRVCDQRASYPPTHRGCPPTPRERWDWWDCRSSWRDIDSRADSGRHRGWRILLHVQRQHTESGVCPFQGEVASEGTSTSDLSPEAAEVRRSVFGISPGSVSSPTARPQTEASSTRRTPRLSRMALGPCDDVFSLPDPAYGQHRFRLGEIRI